MEDRHIEVAKALFYAQENYYKFTVLDIRNRQLHIQNSYFWVASALFTVLAAAFTGLFTDKEFIHLGLFHIGNEYSIEAAQAYLLLHKSKLAEPLGHRQQLLVRYIVSYFEARDIACFGKEISHDSNSP